MSITIGKKVLTALIIRLLEEGEVVIIEIEVVEGISRIEKGYTTSNERED